MTDYALGIDLGTTFTAAAVARRDGARPLALGAGTVLPSVVAVGARGDVQVGEAAEEIARLDPQRAAREFKRRLGDPVPVLLAGEPHRAEQLMAHLVRHVVAVATAQEGAPPAVVVLTHPANHPAHTSGLLRIAAQDAGLVDARIELLTEPEAAAVALTRREPLAVGETIAVYDLGGGTFDAAVVRRGPQRFELLGVPEGLDRFGGIDIDAAVVAALDRAVGGRLSAADRNDPAVRRALLQLREAATAAKESLSSEQSVAVPVRAPGVDGTVTLGRAELEAMVRPRIDETVAALVATVASAGLRPTDLTRVLLVGGSSKIPLVAAAVAAGTGRPATPDPEPKRSIALGAALVGASMLPAAASLQPPSVVPAAPAPAPAPVAPPSSVAPPAGATGEWQPPVRVAPPPPPDEVRRRRRRRIVVAASVVVGLAAGAGVMLAVRDGDDPEQETAADDSAADDTAAEDGARTDGTAAVDGAGVVAAPVELPGVVALTLDPAGRVVALTSAGAVVTVADGATASLAQLDATAGPYGGVAIAADGTLAVSAPGGVLQVQAGATSVLLDAAAAGLGAVPGPVAYDAVGDLYTADATTARVVRRGVDGALSVVLGTGTVAGPGDTTPVDGAPAVAVPIGRIDALALARDGRLVAADGVLGRIVVVRNDGVAFLLATASASPATGVAVAPDGRIAVAHADGSVEVVAEASGPLVVAAAGTIAAPGSISWDGRGGLVVVDGNAVRALAVG